jgi:2-dehydropantoate 2-reductase
MNYLVIGGGALGSFLAHALLRAQQRVQIVDTDPMRCHQINGEGIALVGYRQGAAIPASAVAWEQVSGAFDVAVLCVKPWEVESALQQLGQSQIQLGLLVNASDGLLALQQTTAWPSEVIQAVVNCEMRLREDGQVETGFQNFIWLGNLQHSLTPAMEEVQRHLSFAAPALTTRAIEPMVWSRLLHTLEAGLAALAHLPPLEFYAIPQARRVAARIVHEGLAVAERFGIVPLGFDFFDPPLYRATTRGQKATLDTWIKHAWLRHEQFLVGCPYPFVLPVGGQWNLWPQNPRQELTGALAEIRQAASAVGVATLALAAYEQTLEQAIAGQTPSLEQVLALEIPELAGGV